MIGPQGRKALERATKTVHLSAGRVLFREGAPARSLFILRSGSLGIYVTGDLGHLRLVSLVGAGETVGEMSVISGEPRSATVTAIRDSELWMLSQTRFNALLRSEPDMMVHLMHLLTHRLRKMTRGAPAAIEPRTIAILPASPHVDTTTMARRLMAKITSFGDRAHIVGHHSPDYSAEWFAARERAHDFIILTAQPGDGEWLDVCARQADRILLAADVDTRERTPLSQGLLSKRLEHQLLDLVIVHKSDAPAPSGTRYWCNTLEANRHFHLRKDRDADWSRLARVLCGRANGLVLSGGGARAFAHIGVVRALEEAGIPIDFIGGTSMGGIVGAGVALEWSSDEILERIRETFVTTNPVSDYTLPIVGLVRGRKVERLLERNFGDWDIQDLWHPYYCVSSNLTRGGDHIHRTGLLREALRASISLPGVFPPVPHDDGLLVDGAVTSNLPVNIMRDTHRGKIIAVDVARDLAISPAALRREQRGNWARRLLRPPIVSILIRAGTISSEETDRRQARMADLLITPPLGQIEVRDWKAFDRAVAIGHRHAEHVLEAQGAAFTGCKVDG